MSLSYTGDTTMGEGRKKGERVRLTLLNCEGHGSGEVSVRKVVSRKSA